MKKLITLGLIIILFCMPIMLKKTQGTSVDKLPPATAPEDAQATEEGAACQIFLTVEAEPEPVPLEEYVIGVVSGEMPIGFSKEALKAQAIAARTYALRITSGGKEPIRRDTSHQVYKPEAERKKEWDKDYPENERKVREAVTETEGKVLVHEGELISAMFHSTSNGRTETAKNYGGTDIPYLRSVESPEDADVSPRFEDSETFTLSQWNKRLDGDWNAAQFGTLRLKRNETGRVQQAEANDFTMEGREMREKLGLRSTDFDIAYDPAKKIVHVFTKGYGHGVGMSQYGAEAYAREGWPAEKILFHYYEGTTIKKLEADDSECLKSP
ncbi:autolysin modifier protein [Bhargavaea cecembensis]|uniref:Autolysin modifier protein n=1 Tax=Bhargavaea cecembensis TaxID=394098 RepID=A0A163FD34_9BACL|nr:stage II sporulation protein D [Bhargavaea cecembensis]KZE38417.1 autolysin modifier protein [Bhargavaea cecembensis]